MKEVSPEKFDALIKKNIKLGQCKCGAGGGNIVVLLPWYGNTGVRVECPRCNRKTKLYNVSTFISDTNNRAGSPVIDRSLMAGIKQAVNDWNHGIIIYGEG